MTSSFKTVWKVKIIKPNQIYLTVKNKNKNKNKTTKPETKLVFI